MTADDLIPTGRWQFDQQVTERFEDMLTRSVPHLDVLRDLVTQLADRWLSPEGVVLDLGTSRGKTVARLADRHPSARFTAVDSSPSMVAAAREELAGHDNVTVGQHDLRDGLPRTEPLSLCLAVLTLMFLPVEHRPHLLAETRERLADGGALILVEKVLADTTALTPLVTGAYVEHKLANGYTAQQVVAKQRSLEGALVPLRSSWNVELLHDAGFAAVEQFWRCGPFVGWVAAKERRPPGCVLTLVRERTTMGDEAA